MNQIAVGLSLSIAMKTPRLPLLAASAALALSLACGTTLLRADAPDEAKRREAAEELLKARHTEDIVNGTVNRMGEMTDRISDQAAKQAGPPVDQKEFAQKLRTEARDMIKKDFNWEALRPEFVQAYSQAFTEKELKELTAFYETPLGKKLIATEPEISGKLSKLSQEKAMSIMPRVVQHLREMVAATKPAPAPGSSPGNLLTPPLPPGLSAPPPPPPGLMIPPPPPTGAIPSAPPMSAPPAAPSSATAPGATPAVHPNGKAEPGNP